MKKILGPPLLIATALLLAYAASQTATGRRANVQVPDGFQHVYVQARIGSETKCLISDRAGVTLRRSEPELGRTRWKCRWTGGAPGRGALTALTGKNPAYLFVPFADVIDPVQPWLYGAVRDARGEVDGAVSLPRVRWVELFWDRQYQGLYLQLRLPGKRFAEAGELGRVELLALGDDDGLHCWNRKLKPSCTLYGFLLSEGVFPAPETAPDTAWLEGLASPPGTRVYLLAEVSEGDPTDDRLVPLAWPVAPQDLVVEPGRPYTDGRLGSWRSPAPADPSLTEPPADLEPWLAELDVVEISDRLNASIEATCRLRGCDGSAFGERIQSSPSMDWLRRRAVAEGER